MRFCDLKFFTFMSRRLVHLLFENIFLKIYQSLKMINFVGSCVKQGLSQKLKQHTKTLGSRIVK